jgi:hypothetical protein
MSMQSPEHVDEPLPGMPPDPEAPYGRKADGTPYKVPSEQRERLAAKLAAGRERARAASGKAPSKRASSNGKSRPRAAVTDAAMDAAGYAQKIGRGLRMVAKGLSRRAPVDAAIVAVRADDMAEAWGRVAVTYPRFGAVVERFGKGGDLSDAIGGTLVTLAMLAHVHGLTQGLPIADMIAEAVDDTLETFATSEEFAGAYARSQERMAAALADQGESDAALN